MSDFDTSPENFVPSGHGQFLDIGGKPATSYPEDPKYMKDFINDYYGLLYRNSLRKSAGFAGYGDGNTGYFNAIYGKRITAGFFMSDNALSAIGSRPYAMEGVRIAYEQADYGIDDSGEFQLLGAGTDVDGVIPDSVAMPVGEFNEPTKALPFTFNYGRGLRLLENKDDTIAYKDYMDKMAATYSDRADKSVLAPLYTNIKLSQGVETGLSMLDRVISSHQEIGMVEEGKTVTAEMVSPWGGYTAGKGSFYPFRANGESNIDSNIIDAGNQPLALQHIDQMWRQCSINWNNPNQTNNKVWLMSNIAQEKLAALLRANNLYLDSVYAQKSFHGVQAINGRDTGFLVNSYNNIVILRDGNMNFDYTTKKVSVNKMGNIKLLDMDHLWMSVLEPVTVETVDNAAITRVLQEVHVMNSYMDLRADSFIQHGKIVNLADGL